jgi:hypothetical protein
MMISCLNTKKEAPKGAKEEKIEQKKTEKLKEAVQPQ